MRLVLSLIAALGLALPLGLGQARAADRLIVVELFTSQGCDRCPPVEALLADLATWPDVLPLSLHVDYWDYMGWADEYALDANKLRQMDYLPQTDRKRLFTPLVMIGGLDAAEGYAPMRIVDLIAKHRGVETGIAIEAVQQGADIGLLVQAGAPLGTPARLWLVTYLPHAVAEITRGQNAGQTFRHTNIVTSWRDLGAWDGHAPFQTRFARPDQAAAVLVQTDGTGFILQAARLP